MRKLIESTFIEKIYSDLHDIKISTTDKNTREKANESIKFIEENILNTDKEFIHIMKRMIYKRMQETMYKNRGENKELYDLYQKFKTNSIDINECINEFERISNKYNSI